MLCVCVILWNCPVIIQLQFIYCVIKYFIKNLNLIEYKIYKYLFIYVVELQNEWTELIRIFV
jgi:hypothetical protein